MDKALTDYLQQFREGETFKIIEIGILNNDIYKILVGDDPYSYSFKNTDARDQIPSMVYFALHLVLQDNNIKNEKINEAFKKIPVNEKYICLLLEYYYSYLIYLKRISNLLEIDFTHIIAKIKENISDYKNQYCVIYLTQKINEESEERIFP